MKSSTELNDLSTVSGKLEILIRLLALTVISSDASLKDNASRLHRAGIAPKEIAALLETTPNTVSVALSALKRAGKKNKKSGNR